MGVMIQESTLIMTLMTYAFHVQVEKLLQS